MMAMLWILPAHAQDKNNIGRKEWFEELRQYKHDFLAKELQLSQEQQDKFFPLYDDMENSVESLNRQTRGLEKNIEKADGKASDLEYEKAAEAMFELKSKEGAIEQQYATKFKTVLTPKQMFELKRAERKFFHKLMKEHSKARAAKR